MSVHLMPMLFLPENIHRPNHFTDRGIGYFSGLWPLERNQPRPADMTPVVYELYNIWNELIYIGSTHHFQKRLKQHQSKRFNHWFAYPCPNRISAYNLESRFLDEYMPRFNKRREGRRSESAHLRLV